MSIIHTLFNAIAKKSRCEFSTMHRNPRSNRGPATGPLLPQPHSLSLSLLTLLLLLFTCVDVPLTFGNINLVLSFHFWPSRFFLRSMGETTFPPLSRCSLTTRRDGEGSRCAIDDASFSLPFRQPGRRDRQTSGSAGLTECFPMVNEPAAKRMQLCNTGQFFANF